MEQHHPTAQEQADLEARSPMADYGKTVLQRKWFIALTTVSVTTAVALGSLLLPNMYTAKTKFLPPQQGAGLLSAAMMQGALAAAIGGADLLGESKSTKLYAELLKTEGLRDPVIARFKLQNVYHKEHREGVYQTLEKRVTIKSGKEGIITVFVDDTDPKRAADMANAFVDELKKLSAGMSMTGASNTKAFLEERIQKARGELTDAENQIKAFQSRYKTLDATQQATASASAVAQLTAQLTAQEIQLGVVRRTYADSSQEVKGLTQAIAVLREKIARLQGSSGSGALPGFQQIPERGQEYLHLMRKLKTAESVHEMLVRQYEVARLNAENDVSTIQVIQKALVPEIKSKPARTKIVGIAFVVSLLLSIYGSVAFPPRSAKRGGAAPGTEK